MYRKRVALLALTVTILFCGCPGLIGLLYALPFQRDNSTWSPQSIAQSLVGVLIPVGVYFWLFRSREAQAARAMEDLRFKSSAAAPARAALDAYQRQHPGAAVLELGASQSTFVTSGGFDMDTAMKPVRGLRHDLDAAEETESFVRAEAALKLGDLHALSAVEPLITALDDRYAVVRGDAAQALGKLGDQRAIPRLTALVKEERDQSVIKAAQEALAKLSTSTIPPSS